MINYNALVLYLNYNLYNIIINPLRVMHTWFVFVACPHVVYKATFVAFDNRQHSRTIAADNVHLTPTKIYKLQLTIMLKIIIAYHRNLASYIYIYMY